MTDAILDTTFFIDLKNEDAGAMDLWQRILQGSFQAAFSSITAFELWASRDVDASTENFFLAAFSLLEEASLTVNAAIQAGVWLRYYPRDTRNSRLRDALIAASALERQETVMTRNQRDFRRFPDVQVGSY